MDILVKIVIEYDWVYTFLSKKRAEGKHYHVYMTAAVNKFLCNLLRSSKRISCIPSRRGMIIVFERTLKPTINSVSIVMSTIQITLFIIFYLTFCLQAKRTANLLIVVSFFAMTVRLYLFTGF